jgi:hypothetical protein
MGVVSAGMTSPAVVALQDVEFLIGGGSYAAAAVRSRFERVRRPDMCISECPRGTAPKGRHVMATQFLIDDSSARDR